MSIEDGDAPDGDAVPDDCRNAPGSAVDDTEDNYCRIERVTKVVTGLVLNLIPCGLDLDSKCQTSHNSDKPLCAELSRCRRYDLRPVLFLSFCPRLYSIKFSSFSRMRIDKMCHLRFKVLGTMVQKVYQLPDLVWLPGFCALREIAIVGVVGIKALNVAPLFLLPSLEALFFRALDCRDHDG